MNQGIRTLIYPVKDAQRSSPFSSWASILMSNSLTGVAFRLGDREIALDPMEVFPVLERISASRSTSPLRLTIPPFAPKMKLSHLSRIASTKSL